MYIKASDFKKRNVQGEQSVVLLQIMQEEH